MLGHCAISECPISALPEAVEASPGGVGGHGKTNRRRRPRGPRLVQTTHPDRPRFAPAPPRLLPLPAPGSTRAAPIDAPPFSDEEALALILAARIL